MFSVLSYINTSAAPKCESSVPAAPVFIAKLVIAAKLDPLLPYTFVTYAPLDI